VITHDQEIRSSAHTRSHADPTEQRIIRVTWAVAVAVALVLNTANLFLGDLNQDEGWYLYGARLVAEGRLPYIDFATTQGPMMPFVYAAANSFVTAWGVAGGRFFTSVLGFACALATAWLAYRLVRQEAPRRMASFAAVVAFTFVAVNVYQSYFVTIVKTYALAGLLVVLGFVALTAIEGKLGSAAAALSGALFLSAAGTRASAVFILPVVFLMLIWKRHGKRRRVVYLSFALGGTVAAAVLFLPFLLRAPSALWFALVEYHSGRDVGGALRWVAYKGGFVSRVMLAYSAATICCLLSLAYVVVKRPSRGRYTFAQRAIWISVALVTLVHLLAPFPYDDYQAMIYPAFAAALAVTLIRLCGQLWVVTGVVLTCMAMALASPIIQSWFIGKRDRIWWPLKDAAPLAVLQETAARIKSLPGVKDGDLLLTQDPYLAVETGLVIPDGLELGQFCYFPDWPRAKAEKRHVVNTKMFRDVIETCGAPVAAFSGYGLSIRSPEVQPLPADETQALWKLVRSRYRSIDEVEPFGQADTRLEILVRRTDQ
jgi:hypothetical protein